jgi:hypothetical protein
VRHLRERGGQRAAGRDRGLVLVDARRAGRAALAETLAEGMEPDDLPPDLDRLVEEGALGRDRDAQARLLEVLVEALCISRRCGDAAI